MATPSAAWTRKAAELLADGEWHEQAWLINRLIPLVPPGRAIRRAEATRTMSRGGSRSTPPTERRVPRSEDYLIRYGAQRIVESVLRTPRMERKQDADGTRWVRLRQSSSGD